MQLSYRKDIDGLRAIAVLAVIGFHYFPGVFRGGFIGVDVFFVISGFLITALIHRDVVALKFSIAEFYGRRARRIFPALVCVLALSLAFGFVFMLPGAYRTLGLNTAASAGFVANIALLLQQNYFAPNTDFNPLLHIWSLGVEEQFYLIWPLLLMLFARGRVLLIVAVVLALLSFGFNIVQTSTDATSAFFLPFSRFWELGVGAVLALTKARLAWSEDYKEWMAWPGLALLVAGLLLINRHTAFPGAWALLPVAGTALLIAAGEHARVNRTLLGHPALVYVGLISYPLYMWHWPVLVYTRIIRFEFEPPPLMSVGLIVVSFVLAHLTYRFIERPIRSGGRLTANAITLTVLLAMCAGIGGFVYARQGLPHRYPAALQKLVTDNEKVNIIPCMYESDTLPPANICDGIGPPDKPLVFVWGDSYAFHLMPGLVDLQQRKPYFRLSRYIAFACPPLIDVPVRKPAFCDKSNLLAREKIKALKPDTVIVTARWAFYKGQDDFALVDEKEIRRTIAWIKSAGVRHIVVIGQFPYWKLTPVKIPLREYQLDMLRLAPKDETSSGRNLSFLDSRVFAVGDTVRRIAAEEGVDFIAPASTLCNSAGCLVTVPGTGGEPISRDDGHLTPSASRYYIEKNADALHLDYRKPAEPAGR